MLTVTRPRPDAPTAPARHARRCEAHATLGQGGRSLRRMARAGERPFCLADWSRVLFVHYAVDPAVLQPHVPFPLDLFNGRAYVSLVAFTQENVRPQFAGGLGRLGRRVAAWCARPVAGHAFLNLRTYVRCRGERGIFFLAEWINNRLDRAIGPATYGLPYRLGRLVYAYDAAGLPMDGEVRAGAGVVRFDASVNPAEPFAPAPAGLDEFLLERYTAYTRRGGTLRRFRIWHEPWTQARATVTTRATDLIEGVAPWFTNCRYAGAHFSPGVTNVRIGPPRKLPPTPPRTPREPGRPGPGSTATVLALTALLPLVVVCTSAPRWALMWSIAFGLFFACKGITWRRATGPTRPGGNARSLGYLFAWVGMDAPAFLDPTRKVRPPAAREWLAPALKTMTGAALVWVIARLIPPAHPLLASWVGMVGLALLLHFGTFHLLALAWRRAGVDATPLMRQPARSKSLAEFWSVRWNRGFHQLAHDLVFRPATRAGLRPPAALLATFLASGLVHETVITLPAGGGFGLPTLYFTIEGLAVLLERSRIGRRVGLGSALRGRLFALAVAAAPLPLLFPAPFVGRVAHPFLRAVGAF